MSMEATPTQDSQSEQQSETDVESVEDLAAQVEVLQEENRRLRTAYRDARRTEYRRAALGVGLLGIVAGLGGVLFPASQATLFAFAGIGLFTSVLTYYLTPERFVSASVGERTYTALATFGQTLVSELGLQDTRLYVPTESTTDEAMADVRLFIPEHTNYTLPTADELQSLFVVTEDERARGVAVPSTGATLFYEFAHTMTDSVADTPSNLADQVTEAIVEGFELADSAVAELDAETNQVTIGIQGSAFGDVGRFDHPIASFLATGFAIGLGTPVQLKTVNSDDDQFDYLLIYSWESETDTE
ncbi:hypothetical protein [Halorussus salinisoli]|uniref:hypothetical protein n=1 Tax=Halorussus salinisoli TaxID=2558242 RepID=UPI0010C21FEB|nr:hypothetical protein [Halorussus salinisoli]